MAAHIDCDADRGLKPMRSEARLRLYPGHLLPSVHTPVRPETCWATSVVGPRKMLSRRACIEGPEGPTPSDQYSALLDR